MIFSVLAFIALWISIYIKDRKKSLYVQALNCLFESIYCFTISAFTGAVLSIINIIRTIIFSYSEKLKKVIYMFILFIFETIIVVNCVYTWQGIISLLPTIGSMFRTFALWQTNMKIVRISGLTTSIFYGLYYLIYQSWFMVLGDLVLLIISIFSIYKYDIKNRVERE